MGLPLKVPLFPATFFHKSRNNSDIFTFIVFCKQLSVFRHLLFRNYQETSTMRNKIMICKNNRSRYVRMRCC